MVSVVPQGGPTGLVAALEVVAEVAEPGLDDTFTVQTLRTPVLGGHHLAHTVDGKLDVVGRGKDGGGGFSALRSGFHIILGAGRRKGESRDDKRDSDDIFHDFHLIKG